MKLRLLIPTILLLLPALAVAQLTDPRLPISLDADSTDYDGKSSMLRFEGLRLSQGNIGIEADEGLASKLDFEDSVWKFTGSVIIDIENGHIECDSADLQFLDHQLRLAVVAGSPATFELTREGSDEPTYAEAGKLRYDLDSGVIEFSEEATITENGNQISANFLVYDIRQQRINAESSGSGDGRVRITYTPANAVEDAEDEATEEETTEDEDGSQ